jgi:hypothetical protein
VSSRKIQGEKFIHKVRLDKNGNRQFIDPQGIWPKPLNQAPE